MQDEFSRLGLSVPELHAAAVENLAALPSASISIGKLPGGYEGWLSAEGDNFTAARILRPWVQREFVKELGEQFLMALSHRDDCFCWSVAQSFERQENHAREARERFLHEEYNLTPDILKFSGGKFVLHLEQPVP
jgi:hypothetical protein